jgi:hypothetical protein
MPKIGQAERREKLAINLFDLDRVDPTIRQILLGGKVDLTNAIKMDKNRFDEAGVAFICPLLQAASICDIVRSHDRELGDFPTRVYLMRVAAWEKLPNAAVLTLILDGKTMLNPAIFPPVGERAKPLSAEAVW